MGQRNKKKKQQPNSAAEVMAAGQLPSNDASRSFHPQNSVVSSTTRDQQPSSDDSDAIEREVDHKAVVDEELTLGSKQPVEKRSADPSIMLSAVVATNEDKCCKSSKIDPCCSTPSACGGEVIRNENEADSQAKPRALPIEDGSTSPTQQKIDSLGTRSSGKDSCCSSKASTSTTLLDTMDEKNCCCTTLSASSVTNGSINGCRSKKSTAVSSIVEDSCSAAKSIGTSLSSECCNSNKESARPEQIDACCVPPNVTSTAAKSLCCSSTTSTSQDKSPTPSQSSRSSNSLADRVVAYRTNRGASIVNSTQHRYSANMKASQVETVRLSIGGMTCSGCCTRIEGFLQQQPGIQSVNVSLLTARGVFEFDPSMQSSKSIEQLVSTLGFSSSPMPSESLVSIVLHIGRERPSRAKQLLLMIEGVISVHEERDGSFVLKAKEHADTLAHNRVVVEYDPEVIGARTLVRRLTSALGFQVIASAPHPHTLETEEEEVSKFKRYLLWSLLLSLPVFIVEFVVPWLSHDLEVATQQDIVSGVSYENLIGLLCATPVFLIVAYPIHESAFLALRYGSRVTMDVLISLSSFSAYIFSIMTILFQILHLTPLTLSTEVASPSPLMDKKSTNGTFFEVTTMLITLIFVGRYMEKIVKAKAAHSVDALLQIQAKTAILIEESNNTIVPAASTRCKAGKGEVTGPRETYIDVLLVERGDILKVLPGARVPTDGVVFDGASTVDESMVTGESRKVPKTVGSTVVGGTINAQGVLVMRVTHTINESMLARIVHMVDDAQSSKCTSHSVADAVSSYFTTVIICVAGLMFALWFWLAREHHIDTDGWAPFPFALRFAITVLVISCPCAISLAVPTAIMVATTIGSQFGVLFKGGQALEALDKIDVVMFDKTGTLTSAKLQVVDFLVAGGGTTSSSRWSPQPSTLQMSQQQHQHQLPARKLWTYLATAEKNSEHAIAQAVLTYARKLHTPMMDAKEFEAVPGCGVKCRVDSHHVSVGSLKWMLDVLRVDVPLDLVARNEHYQKQGCVVVCLAIDNALCALVALQDTPRLEAQFVIEQLRHRKIQTWIVTGDQRETALAVAKELGIHDVTVIADALPHQKVDKVRLLQGIGKHVAFIGDGVNDGPALAMADIGVAIGAGTDVAIESADLVLVKDDLRDLLNALDLSQATNRLIRWNFTWGFLYNLLMMPLACGVLYPFYGVYIPPAFAGLSELLSSVPVILFSLMLNFWKPPFKQGPMSWSSGYGSDEVSSLCIKNPNNSYISIDIPKDASESTPLLVKK